MAFVDSHSFSHRFTDSNAGIDGIGYQEIIHQCSEVNAMGLTRHYFHYALGCGFAPKNIIEAMETLAQEYSGAYGYDEGK
jgi:hypothetical protein